MKQQSSIQNQTRRRPKFKRLDFNSRTYVMGILNITPDSFSDGGLFFDKSKALRQAIKMAEEGADIIDVGGESTRPGARDLSVNEEIDRVVPAIEAISKVVNCRISIDTRKSKVAEEALKAGAVIINDVSGLRHDADMADVAASNKAMVIIMHMKGTPKDMQKNPRYANLMGDIIRYLRVSIGIAKKAGVEKDHIVIDPGIGFGKTVEHNLAILKYLSKLKSIGLPICVGTSRKSFIGKILEIPDAGDRLVGTVASQVAAILNGANMLRVHDVREAVEASKIADSIMRAKLK